MKVDYCGIFSFPLFHAYLLEGEKEVLDSGTEELVLRILCKKNPPCRKCTACEKYLSKNHPDVKTAGGDFSVKQIREFLSDLWLSPSDGDRKIYIFDDADMLSEYSQNTLLLPIEDPPEDVFFIIRCSNAEKILATVKSRCRIICLNGEGAADEKTEELCRDFCTCLFRRDSASLFSLLAFGKESREPFSAFVKYFCAYCEKKARLFASQKNSRDAAAYLALFDAGNFWAEKSEMNLNMNLTVTGFVADCISAIKTPADA